MYGAAVVAVWVFAIQLAPTPNTAKIVTKIIYIQTVTQVTYDGKPVISRVSSAVCVIPKTKPVAKTRQRVSVFVPKYNPPTPVGFVVWVSSTAAKRIRDCESGNTNAVSPSGTYMGAWQMDMNFWRSNGGLKFAKTPLGATGYEQDLVAYKGYLSRGWEPWTCARILGYYP